MKQVIRDFKAIMADRHERREFVGSFVSAIVMVAVMYLLMVMFQSDGLLK